MIVNADTAYITTHDMKLDNIFAAGWIKFCWGVINVQGSSDEATNPPETNYAENSTEEREVAVLSIHRV